MKDDEKIVFESISRKLNVIISLLMIRYKDDELATENKKVFKLNEWGLSNEEIAQILGKNSIQVSKLLYKAKKGVKKNG